MDHLYYPLACSTDVHDITRAAGATTSKQRLEKPARSNKEL